LVGVFPDFLRIPELNYYLSDSYSSMTLRIASTSPAVVSAPLVSYSTFSLGIRPSIRIDTTSTTIARDKVLQLRISGSATSPFSITTSEGTVYSVRNYWLSFADERVNTYLINQAIFILKRFQIFVG
jgi:hypothetical protein